MSTIQDINREIPTTGRSPGGTANRTGSVLTAGDASAIISEYDAGTSLTAGSPLPDDAIPATRDGRRAVAITTGLCVGIAVIGHASLLGGWLLRGDSPDNALPWQPVVGGCVAAIAMVSFGGMYYASLRARVAIMGSFVLTFLLLMTYVLTVREIAESTAQSDLAEQLIGDFRAIVQTIIGFYFGTEALLSIAKIIKSPGGLAAMRSDRDLPSGTTAVQARSSVR